MTYMLMRCGVLIFFLFVFRIQRAALWILGEYCNTHSDIQSVMTLIRQSLGEVGTIFSKIFYIYVFFLIFGTL